MANWKYNRATHRYRAPNGKFLSDEAGMRLVDDYLQAKQSTPDGLFDLLRAGQISVKDAQLIGARELSKTHLASAMAAKGGKIQMAQSDYGRVGGYLKPELGHWRDLMKQLEAGRPIDGSVKTALRGYFAAAANTYHRVQHIEMETRGWDEYKNILADGVHHCRGKAGRPSCSSITRKGYTKVGSQPERGKRGCYWYCHCFWRYRNSTTGEVRS